jgi:hypothetical protein
VQTTCRDEVAWSVPGKNEYAVWTGGTPHQ